MPRTEQTLGIPPRVPPTGTYHEHTLQLDTLHTKGVRKTGESTKAEQEAQDYLIPALVIYRTHLFSPCTRLRLDQTSQAVRLRLLCVRMQSQQAGTG